MNRSSSLGRQRIEFIPIFEVFTGEGEYNVIHALARYRMRAHQIARLQDIMKRLFQLELLSTNLFFWHSGWKALCKVYMPQLSLLCTCISVRLAVN
jgi:hypothetical protein